jgi:V/A-type H+/Na+-transporting ATPase subunit I
MLYPQTMTEVELIVPEHDALAVTRTLADMGIFHESDAHYMGTENGTDSILQWRDKAVALASLERRILTLMDVLHIDVGSPSAEAAMVEVESVLPVTEQTEQEIQAIVNELDSEQKTLEQLQSYIRQLSLIADMSLDVGVLGHLRHVFSLLGVIPADHVERLETSLERIPFVLLTLHQDARQAIVLLLGTQRNADVLDRAARSAYLNPIQLPDAYQGTPQDMIASLRASIEATQQQIVLREGLMTELRQARKQQLQMLIWRVRASQMLAHAMARCGRLRYTYLIVGWVPASSLDEVNRRLKKVSEDILIETAPIRRGGNDQDVPVALRNPGILGAFQGLVTTYGRPRYEEIDPTLLMTITFPLLFGAMFGDVGHGLVLALVGWLLGSGKISALRGMSDLGTIICVCGVVATLFGFLYGSVFGFEDVLPALWLHPMEDMMSILAAAVGAGVVLLSVGYLIGIFNAWVARDWERFFFSPKGIAGLVLYWSLLALAAGSLIDGLSIPPLVLALLIVLSGFSVTFAEALGRLVQGHRPLIRGGLAAFVVQAFFELFETLIGLLSNSLSYVRVGAFAVAHGGLSAVVFILAEMASPSHGVGYWIVVLLGNLFIIGFEGLIVGIQTLRLEYYEFFSRFFVGGGSSYTPLTILPDTRD